MCSHLMCHRPWTNFMYYNLQKMALCLIAKYMKNIKAYF